MATNHCSFLLRHNVMDDTLLPEKARERVVVISSARCVVEGQFDDADEVATPPCEVVDNVCRVQPIEQPPSIETKKDAPTQTCFAPPKPPPKLTMRSSPIGFIPIAPRPEIERVGPSKSPFNGVVQCRPSFKLIPYKFRVQADQKSLLFAPQIERDYHLRFPCRAVTQNDIVSGRRSDTQHQGNKGLRELTESNAMAYHCATLNQKAFVARDLCNSMRLAGCRFLRQEPDIPWYENGDNYARRRISRLLRDHCAGKFRELHKTEASDMVEKSVVQKQCLQSIDKATLKNLSDSWSGGKKTDSIPSKTREVSCIPPPSIHIPQSSKLQISNPPTLSVQTISIVERKRKRTVAELEGPSPFRTIITSHPSERILLENTRDPGSPYQPLPLAPSVNRNDNFCRSSTVTVGDILLGRGRQNYYNEGNVWFRELLSNYRPAYHAAAKFHKRQIASNICNYLRLSGVRFLMEGTVKDEWSDCGDARAQKAISQYLRAGKSTTNPPAPSASDGHHDNDYVQPKSSIQQPTSAITGFWSRSTSTGARSFSPDLPKNGLSEATVAQNSSLSQQKRRKRQSERRNKKMKWAKILHRTRVY